MSLRRQRAHYATGRGSVYFGVPQVTLRKTEVLALLAIKEAARRAALSRASRARARLRARNSPLDKLTPRVAQRPKKTNATGADLGAPKRDSISPRPRKVKQLVTTESRKKFHTSDCRWAVAFLSSERVKRFETRQEALKAGYRQCKTCRP